MRTSRRGPEPAMRPVVETVTLREALSVLDAALSYADHRTTVVEIAAVRRVLAERLERNAKR